MATTVSTTSNVGLKLASAQQDPLIVTNTGTINTTGAYAVYGSWKSAWSVTNAGQLSGAQFGVTLASGGTVTNGAGGAGQAILKGGTAGLVIRGAAGTVNNYATIQGTGTAGYGVGLIYGGTLANAATADIGGVAQGVIVRSTAGTIDNNGRINASGAAGIGVDLVRGGSVSNGAGVSPATISGGQNGVSIWGAGSVTNLGTISGQSGTGILWSGTGTISNGSSSATTALVAGGTDGIRLTASTIQSTAVINEGTVIGTAQIGIYLLGSGRAVNGAAAVTSALASGAAEGIYVRGGGSVANYGTVIGTGTASSGVMIGGGTREVVANGGSGAVKATISGALYGVVVNSNSVSLSNYGTILSAGTAAAMRWGGNLVNGAPGVRTALISGDKQGVYSDSSYSSVLNFGTIVSKLGDAVYMFRGGWVGDPVRPCGPVTNGALADASALLSGSTNGVDLSSEAVLTNYGTVIGNSNAGALLTAIGTVTNGAQGDLTALIAGGRYGVELKGGINTLVNEGTVSGATGLSSQGGGVITNGASAATGALIVGTSANGVYIAGIGSVMNDGTVQGIGGNGIILEGVGGSVSNGAPGSTAATIVGSTNGIEITGAAGTVDNYGLVKAGDSAILLTQGGQVINGGSGATAALISGAGNGVDIGGVAGTVTNFTTISGGGNAVDLSAGGSVTNGAVGDKTAVLSGSTNGVLIGAFAGNVANYATIAGTAGAGVDLTGGGSLSNTNAETASAAYIGGLDEGVLVQSTAGTIENNGKINASGPAGIGVDLVEGGSVSNGAGVSPATISGGQSGVSIGGAGSVTNFGTISGQSGAGILWSGTGTISNGSSSATTALVTGGTDGIRLTASTIQSTAVFNEGTVIGTAAHGIYLLGGGTVVNGAAAVTSASVSGAADGIYIRGGAGGGVVNYGTINGIGTASSGIRIGGPGVIDNQGTIQGTGSSSLGVHLVAGGTIVNGSSTADGAEITGAAAGVLMQGGALPQAISNLGTITGAIGIEVTAGNVSTSIVNAGSIIGTDGTAVSLGNEADLLSVDPGAVFVGVVNGGGGSNTLELAAGSKAGSIAGIGSTFSNFSTLQVDSGASWTDSGSNSIATLADSGTLTVAGTLDIIASINPADGGTIELGTTAKMQVASVLGSGPAMKFLGTDLLAVEAPGFFGVHVGTTLYSGPLIEDFLSVDTIDLVGIAPTLSGAGLVLNYATATGLLTISRSGGGALASLLFQNGSLGSGAFHTGTDSSGGTLLTRF